jgi:hypothetical protein
MLRKFTHSTRWIEMPLPRVTKPVMASGGIGLQHLPICVSSLSTPTTRMRLSPARLLRVWISGSGGRGSAPPRSAVSIARMPTSPRAARKEQRFGGFQSELGGQLVEVGLGLPLALQSRA